MPELPEVETIVGDLRTVLLGQKFLRIISSFEQAISPSVSHFERLGGALLITVKRRGKYIIFGFDGGQVLVLHLRMTGRLRIMQSGLEPAIPFERTRLDFAVNSLRFGDIRKFGKIYLGDLGNYELLSGISKLGPEPLSEGFSVQNFVSCLKGNSRPIKAVLLDQSMIAGVGNIYADEACFRAAINPWRPVKSLNNDEIRCLYDALRFVLSEGINNRGTSFSDFEDAFGRKGKNQKFLRVYGRANKDCLQCLVPLVKTKLAGRGTVHCPNCQV